MCTVMVEDGDRDAAARMSFKQTLFFGCRSSHVGTGEMVQ